MSNFNELDDLDFLYSTARARAMEGNLLTRERLTHLAEAKSTEDITKVLSECGWEHVNFDTRSDMEASLAAERNAAFATVASIAPDKNLVAVFQMKYDYHNLKTILKGEAKDEAYEHLLIDCGRIPVKTLLQMMKDGNFSAMAPAMRRSVEEAKDVLNRTGDPQYADIALDRGWFDEMSATAKQAGSDFVSGYVALMADSVNLRTAVRLKKMGRPYDYLKQSFIRGGSVAMSRLLADMTPDLLESIYGGTPLKEAAIVGGAALRGEAGLAKLDMECDNALMRYLKSAKYVGLGEQPLLGYLGAKEAELTAIRIIMSGRLSGLEPEMIMERLRETYA